MRVLSLFDGMSCGMLALESCGIKVQEYYASEIDQNAIRLSKSRFPNIKHIGSVLDINYDSLPKINLLIGGSPCQSFSTAGNGKGFDGESGLFYEYVKALKILKPDYFLLENVKMKKEWRDIISKELGVQPILIKSNLFTAQNRERLYWTNIPVENNIEDKNILIQDIVQNEEDVDIKYWLKAKNTHLLWNKINFEGIPNIAAIDVYNKRYKKDNKVPTLTLPHHNSLRLWQNGRIRKFTPQECEKLQGVPVGFTGLLPDNERYKLLGNGWTVPVVAHILKGIDNT